MMRKHKTTAEMVKQLLNVIEERVERANQRPVPRTSRFDTSIERASI